MLGIMIYHTISRKPIKFGLKRDLQRLYARVYLLYWFDGPCPPPKGGGGGARPPPWLGGGGGGEFKKNLKKKKRVKEIIKKASFFKNIKIQCYPLLIYSYRREGYY